MALEAVHTSLRAFGISSAFGVGMTTWTNPDECLSDLVKLLHTWWDAARGSADVPDRADLRPEEMKPLLPFLFIADAEHDPFRVRYRLVGSRAAEVTGFDVTGR